MAVQVQVLLTPRQAAASGWTSQCLACSLSVVRSGGAALPFALVVSSALPACQLAQRSWPQPLRPHHNLQHFGSISPCQHFLSISGDSAQQVLCLAWQVTPCVLLRHKEQW